MHLFNTHAKNFVISNTKEEKSKVSLAIIKRAIILPGDACSLATRIYL
jgi:hypothetical protein